jgi:hypothetical protein
MIDASKINDWCTRLGDALDFVSQRLSWPIKSSPLDHLSAS